jgi:competence protein ComGC
VSTLTVIIIVVVLLVILLAIGGMVVVARRRRAGEAGFEASLEEVNRQLAAAHAQDKGWEPSALNAAARRAFAEERVADEVREESLIAVLDRPGTDEDRAVFRFVTDAGTFLLTLGRKSGEWAALGVERA